MKKILAIVLIGFSLTHLWSQVDRNFRIPLIGEVAPSFTAESTSGTVNFPSDFGNKWKVLVSHPQDFTPVCSSELLELANLQKEFDKLNVKIVVVSTDELATHKQWVKALGEIKYKNREPQEIKFPLVDDHSKGIAKLYGMIHSTTNTNRDVRGVYIISPNNIVQSISFYPMSVGRNIDEIKRSVIALQTAEEGVTATPANWQPGHDLLIPYKKSSTATKQENEAAGIYEIAWFMTFKKNMQNQNSTR
jgi:peroxiredoxin 2/4